jgi:6-phosphogluconolactonase
MIRTVAGALFLGILAAGCGGGDDGPPTYTIGGSVSGLAGSGLVILNNGGGDLTVTENGPFTFSGKVSSGGAYSVTVKTQPVNPSQICEVSNGSGQVSGSNVTAISVSCKTLYSVGGVVQGLSRSQFSAGLVLQNNGGDDLTVSADGSFTFPQAVLDGAAFDVTVKAQPSKPSQTCTPTNASGTVSGADIDQIDVDCRHDAPQVAYTANTIGNISIFSAAADGSLDSIGSVSTINSSPYPLAIDPSGQFLFAGSRLGGSANLGSVASYRINPATAQLTEIDASPATDSNRPNALVVDPTSRFVFVANQFGGATSQGSVSVFGIDAATGALTEISGSPYTVNFNPRALAINSAGTLLYLVGTSVTAFAVNAQTGTLTAVPGSPFAVHGDVPQSIAVDPTGRFAYVTASGIMATPPGITAYAIDSHTGALTEISGSPFVTSGTLTSIAIDPSGKFLYAPGELSSPDQDRIFGWSINASSGVLTALSGSPFQDANGTLGVAVDRSGRFLYATRSGGAGINLGTVFVYGLDATSGQLTGVNSNAAPSAGFPVGFAVH